MKKIIALFCFCLMTGFSLWSQTTAAEQDIVPGELLIQLKAGVSVSQFELELSQHNLNNQLSYAKQIGKRSQTHLLRYDPVVSVAEELLAEVQQLPSVIAAQLNYYVQSRTEPNDLNFSEQWDMNIIDAPGVWDITTGGVSARGDTIVLAILDSGFDIEHQDLRESVWYNREEIPNDGLDNEGNGYTDDIVGWNFKEQINIHPISAHGTPVAGIAGATGNNQLGVTGVNWNVKLMLLTTTQVDHVISAYEYVIDQRERYNTSGGAEGAFVVATNASFGKSRFYCDQLPLWGQMYDLMGAVGVLTGAGVANETYNVENEGDMPTTCPSEFLITTTNTDINDQKSIIAAFGTTSVDMGTPGDGSYTISPGNTYGTFGGTSASAPHLTGAIGLLYSLPCSTIAERALSNPSQTAIDIKNAILGGVDPTNSMEGKTVTGGRLNIFNSMVLLQELCGSTTGPLEIIRVYPNPTDELIQILIETPDFEDSYQLRAFNALGQLIFQQNFAPIRFGPKLMRISAAQWSPGVYFIELNGAGKHLTTQVVVY